MYRSSPFRSTLNTGYITCLDTCKVCTEAVHSVALWTRVSTCFRFKYVQKQAMRSKMQKKGVQEPKLREAKRARKRVRGAFQGRRTSRFAGIYIYISPVYSVILPIYPSPRLFVIAGIQATRRGGSNAIPSSQSRSTSALRPSRVVMRKHFCFCPFPENAPYNPKDLTLFSDILVFVFLNDAWWFVGMFANLELIQLFEFMKLPVVLKVKQVWLWNTTWIS